MLWTKILYYNIKFSHWEYHPKWTELLKENRISLLITDKSGYLIIIGLVVTFQIKIYVHHHYSCKVCSNVDVNGIALFYCMKEISELFCWKHMDWYFSDASMIFKLFMQNMYKFHLFSNSFFSYGGHAELKPILASLGGNVESKQVAVHRMTRIERHTTI